MHFYFEMRIVFLFLEQILSFGSKLHLSCSEPKSDSVLSVVLRYFSLNECISVGVINGYNPLKYSLFSNSQPTIQKCLLIDNHH